MVTRGLYPSHLGLQGSLDSPNQELINSLSRSPLKGGSKKGNGGNPVFGGEQSEPKPAPPTFLLFCMSKKQLEGGRNLART